jgi:preprotein translocase subunit SecF
VTEDNGTRRAKHAAGDDPIEESVKDADTVAVTTTDDEPPISRAVIDTSAVADEDATADADEADDADDGKDAPAKSKPAKPDADSPHHGFLSRLYTGTGGFEVIGKRRMWFMIGGAMVLIAIASIAIRGFTFGIDFAGGTKVSMPQGAGADQISTSQVADVFTRSVGSAPQSVVVAGSGNSATVQIRAEALDTQQTQKLTQDLFDAFHPKNPDGQVSKDAISTSDVSATWGGQITKKALLALVVFVAIVTAYITLRYERYMAAAAMATMFFDLIVTAGVYSMVGFEVTPATVIGLLTILGFSLYDTVIVFDKVEENTEGFEHSTRRTYAELANLAVNQTFMRSINTSLISVLPILALMVVAVWLLGVGTLQDLALVQLVGVVVGTYSSIFFATPLLVAMRERTDLVRTHTRRVLNRRAKAAGKGSAKSAADSGDTDDESGDADAGEKTPVGAGTGTSRPSRPSRPGRPTGKRNPRRA